MAAITTTSPALDPPFRGYIENTFDALLVFEAARRGMIPRVTRRLIERERGMIQSGAVFVFDEHESGIRRWTDGLVWSPSRILGNFLVYRETDKRAANPPTPMSPSAENSSSPSQVSPAGTPIRPGTGDAIHIPLPTSETHPILGHGALPRPRSASEGGGPDRQRERQLVGSLTNSYKFKDRGLVKKTMSVTVNGFAQHMISYYSVEDVLAGKLRSPSTVPELASLEISAEYLHKQNFRFPPMIEIGQDGVPRYRGEPEEPTSPISPTIGMSVPSFPTSPTELYDPYSQQIPHPPPHHQPMPMRIDPQSPSARHRSITVPMSIPIPPHSPTPYAGQSPSSARSPYYEQHHSLPMHAPAIIRQHSASSMTSPNALRPGSSSRRYDPYGGPASVSPRMTATSQSYNSRRQSQPGSASAMHGYGGHPDYYPSYDIKPDLSSPHQHPNPYNYHPPATAPSSFSDFGSHFSPDPALSRPSASYGPSYTWQHTPTSRLAPLPREYVPANPPGSAGSNASSGHVHTPTHPQQSMATYPDAAWTTQNGVLSEHATPGQVWEGHGYTPDTGDWRGQQGTSVG